MTNTRVKIAALLVGTLVAVGGCEKAAENTSKPSGALSSNESGLLSHLPAGAQLVFGGNMYDAQRWLATSPLGKLSQQMQPAPLVKWNECLSKQKQMAMVMAGGVDGDALRMSLFMKGLTVDNLRRCAEVAGIAATADPDSKYIAIEMPTPQGPMTAAYLGVDGGLYSRMGFSLTGLGAGALAMTAVTRADLERDQAGLATANLATDVRIQGLLAKVDRRRPFFFAGSAAGTPIADKVGAVYGSFSIEDGIAFDGVFELRGAGAIDDALRSWSEAKRQVDNVPAAMSSIKGVVRAVKMSKSGDGLRVSARISNRQLEEVVSQVGPFIPQLGR